MTRRPQQRHDTTLMMEPPFPQENKNSKNNHTSNNDARTRGGHLVLLDDNDLSSYPLPYVGLQQQETYNKKEMRMIDARIDGDTMAVKVPPFELEYKKLGESQCSTYIHIAREHRDDDHDLCSSSSSLTDSNEDFLFRPSSSRYHAHPFKDLDDEKDHEEEISSSSHEESSLLSFTSWLMVNQDQKLDLSTTIKNDCWDATAGEYAMEPKCVPYAQLCFDPQSKSLVTLMEISVTSKMGAQSKRLCIIHSSKEVPNDHDHDYEKKHPNNFSKIDSSTASVRSNSSFSDEETFPVFPSAPPDSPKVKERYDEPIILSTVNYQDSWWEDADIGLYLLHECQDPWVLTNKAECGCSEAVKKLITVSKCLIYRTKHSSRDCNSDWKCSHEPFAGLAYSFLSDI